MKNLIAYKDDCFEVHRRAVNAKHNGEVKNRLLQLNPIIEGEYSKYAENFKNNTLNYIVPNDEANKAKSDLGSIYNYQSLTIRNLRENIMSLQVSTVITTCQNCTLNDFNTLDHILPQSEFPAFVVNPQNLFPCCSECNSKKSNIIEQDNKRFLNLYLDTFA